MNVSLPPQLDAYVRDLVREGDYGSASEVVREGLRLLKRKRARDEKLAELRDLIREGLESGTAQPVSREEMKALVRDRIAERRAHAGGDGAATG
ncbi:MAG: type II toxin-antitoxin system ParD family antitoxin [Bacteroidota bacterium]